MLSLLKFIFMHRKRITKIKKHIFFILCLSLLIQANAYDFSSFKDKKKGFLPNYSVTKYGTLIGIQRGKFFTLELGIEQQRKELKLVKPNTFSWNALLEYAWEPNTMGLRGGVWYKTGRASLTVGADVIGTSNFDQYNIGLAPAVGFKLVGFHIIASYNAFITQKVDYDYNTLHLSIRYFISRKRDFKRTDK